MPTTVPMWFVRAGKAAVYAATFRSEGYVSLGWREVGALEPDTPDEEVDRRFAEAFPNKEEATRDTWANQVMRFLREVRVGDTVVTYDAADRAYLLGRVDSEPFWVDEERPRRRTVTWTHRVDRDSLTESARNKLGSIATFFKVGAEAESELRQNASELFGDTSAASIAVRGQRAAALDPEDFAVLRRNPKSIPWPTLPEEDRKAIKNLRQRLLSYAVKLRDDLATTVTLKPFASHPTPSGRNASFYWACVYPQTAPNKSFAFQLFVIVRPDAVEYGFGSGSATGEMDDSKIQELRIQFEAQRERLKSLAGSPAVKDIGKRIVNAGFRLRSRWLGNPDEASPFSDLSPWILHAAGADGGGAAVSKFLTPEEALQHGDDFGDFLVRELRLFVPLIDAIYARIAPTLTESRAPAAPLPPTTLTIEWLLEETLWDRADIEQIVDTLTQQTPQIILAGPPGTSKTWIAELLARYLTQDRPHQTRTVQFHPSYSYEEFIEGLRPQVTNQALSFEPHQGVLLRICSGLTSDSDYRVLVVDEMNRANLPKVFGELLYLLEYRDKAIDLQYSPGFRLSKRLLMIGTMNTADRSIRSIDVALRRRFDVFECLPSATVMKRYFETRDNEVDDLIAGFDALNAALTEHLDRHHTIGHAFLMTDPMTPARLRHIWDHKLGPLIEEYFFDQPDIAAEFTLSRFWPSAVNVQG